MEDGNAKPSTKSYKISVPRKHLKHRRIKAESMPEKLFNKGDATMRKCSINSKAVNSEDISGEYEQTVNAISCRIENQHAVEVADCGQVNAGHKNMVEKPTALETDPSALVGDEDNCYEPVVHVVADCGQVNAGHKNLVEKPTALETDPSALVGDEDNCYEPAVQDEQKRTKRRNHSETPVQGSRTSEQETCDQLEAQIKKLKADNSTCCREMQEISASCQELRKENRRLLKKLKKVCPPDTIAHLEVRNPDTKVDNQECT